MLSILIAGLIYLIWYSPVFIVQKVDVKGVNMSQDEILDILGADTIGSNILFWRRQTEHVLDPRFDTFNMRKNYFKRTVQVTATEREKSFAWCFEASGDCFWTDKTGFIFSPAPASSGGLITVISDWREMPPGIGGYVLPASMNENLNSIIAIIGRLDLSVDSIKIENIKLRELLISASNGPRIIFSLSIDPDFTETAIRSLMESKSWTATKTLNLTVPGRAYPSY